AAGHQHADDVDAVRRRDFGGVEHGDAAAGAGAGVEKPPAVREPVDDLIDGVGDLFRLGGNRIGDEPVLLLDEPDDLDRRSLVDVDARVEAILTHGSNDIIRIVAVSLMQKLRLAWRGWARRREQAQSEFLAKNAWTVG